MTTPDIGNPAATGPARSEPVGSPAAHAIDAPSAVPLLDEVFLSKLADDIGGDVVAEV